MEITEVIKKAYAAGASDVHLLFGRPVMLRINGTMSAYGTEVLQQMDLNELMTICLSQDQKKTLEETGEIDAAVSIPGLSRIFVNVYRQQGMYAAAIRLLAPDVPSPGELAVPASVVTLAQESKGLVLINGEAGSGKSTTTASLLNEMAGKEAKSIITIENPIEYLLSPGKSIISQREIGIDTSGYAEAVRASRRQDADVVYIGELPDTETIMEAILTAEAGHLVISSLYTCRTEDALHRLICSFPHDRREEMQKRLAEILKGVVTKKLLPRNGTKGRIAVYEIMLSDKEIRERVAAGRISEVTALIEQKQESGMQTMDGAILSAYMRSEISAETAVSCALDQDRMKNRMKVYTL